MKRLIPAIALLLSSSTAVWAASPATLTSLRAIHALSNAEASQHQRVAFEATVTYFRGYERTLFVQDEDLSIFVLVHPDITLAAGDRVLVRGTMQESFRPIVKSDDDLGTIKVLHHGELPEPAPANFSVV